jgi:hypothetical protein
VSGDAGELCGDIRVTLTDDATNIYVIPLNAEPQDLGALDGGVSKSYTASYSIPETVGNEIQGDSCVFTMTASLGQTH